MATQVSTGRIVGIDTLRGLAALAVFVCHLGGYWSFLELPWKVPEILALGAHGVDVFIVVSGFCLMLPVLAPDSRLLIAPFWGRRAFRILPAYWVALAFAVVLAVLPSTWPHVVGQQATPLDVVLYAVGLQTWSADSVGAINGSLWSVSVEIQLYLLFPLLIILWRRVGILPLLGGALAVAIVWDVLGLLVPSAPLGIALGAEPSLPARLIQFCIGMAFATWVVRFRLPSRLTMAALAAVFLFLSVIASTLQLPIPVRTVVWALTGAALIGLVTHLSSARFIVRVLERFGERSFSFYLLHQPITLLFAAAVALIPGGWITQLGIGGIACFVLVLVPTLILFRLVEWPSHLAGKRRFGSPTPRVAAEASAPK